MLLIFMCFHNLKLYLSSSNEIVQCLHLILVKLVSLFKSMKKEKKMRGPEVHDDTRNWYYRRDGVFGVMVNSSVIRKSADVAALFP